MAVSIVTALGLFMLAVAKMIIHLSHQYCVKEHFAKCAAPSYNICFRFSLLGRFTGQGLISFLLVAAFLSHNENA